MMRGKFAKQMSCGRALLSPTNSEISSRDYNKFCLYDDKISATDVGRCAFDKFSNGNYEDSNSLTPLYLKQSSAESKGTD